VPLSSILLPFGSPRLALLKKREGLVKKWEALVDKFENGKVVEIKWGKSARTRLYSCHIKLNSLKVTMMRSPLLSITTSRPLLLIHYTHKLNMSTKPQFLCMVHDHPGTMQKRIEVRQAHLSVVGTNKAVVAGGNHQPNPLSTIDGNKN